jgi:hypothetical protein
MHAFFKSSLLFLLELLICTLLVCTPIDPWIFFQAKWIGGFELFNRFG